MCRHRRSCLRLNGHHRYCRRCNRHRRYYRRCDNCRPMTSPNCLSCMTSAMNCSNCCDSGLMCHYLMNCSDWLWSCRYVCGSCHHQSVGCPVRQMYDRAND